ncbi:MAG: ATP-dependent metallopeptidase FtsH/Yme1/Tma family protein, partial [Deinococcota bacterium]
MLIILGIFMFNQFNSNTPSREIPYSTFTEELVREGRVRS